MNEGELKLKLKAKMRNMSGSKIDEREKGNMYKINGKRLAE